MIPIGDGIHSRFLLLSSGSLLNNQLGVLHLIRDKCLNLLLYVMMLFKFHELSWIACELCYGMFTWMRLMVIPYELGM
jgi:hypothetical protein